MGASSPSDYGDYFAWGETRPKSEYTEENSLTWEKNIGDIGGNPQYDAARANWGGSWRLPTQDELMELKEKCTWIWTTQDGHKGYKVKGPNGKSIFLPAAGWRGGTSLLDVGEYGDYWSSAPYESSTQYAFSLDFDSSYYGWDWSDRYYGHSVRPVSDSRNKTDAKSFRDRYKLIRTIGKGGYGVIWLACDTLNNTEVAIKIYKDSISCDIARKEYEIGMNLYHPNILPSYDFNHYERELYIVMPYCSFGSIDKLCGKILEHTLWRIIKDVASGLECLHNYGIMHLDIKPANILLNSQGRYVISDFGLSHGTKCFKKIHLQDNGTVLMGNDFRMDTSLIHSYDKAKTIGATAYMSPEMFDSNIRIDTYSDIWSLGVSIYELVTGELPFYGLGGKQQLSDSILTLQCDKCSVKLRNLIDACINPNPQNRPSATHIIALADSVIAGDENAPLFDLISNDTVFRKFHNTYNETILDAMKRYKIAKSTDKPLYGIVDDKGNIIVDFLYDEIGHLEESSWPGPGVNTNTFIGAFFRQGEDAGLFIVKDDGNITEYKRCSYKEFVHRCQLS